MPEISIIVPVYQVEKYLERCIASVLAQTVSDYECILVNDGSTDRSGELCNQYAAQDPRFFVIHKENGGLSSARNAALDVAKGAYICFLDSDDVLHPRMLEILLEALKKSQADIAATGLKAFGTDSCSFRSIGTETFAVLERKQFIEQLLPDYFGRISVTACGKVYKRHIFETLRFPEGEIYEDLHVYLDVLLRCERICIVQEDLYYYYQNPLSITRSNYMKYERFGEFVVREKHIRFFEEQGLEEQTLYAVNDYLTFFMRNYFAVRLRYQERLDSIKPHVNTFCQYIPKIVFNKYVCKMRKVCTILMLPFPKIAYVIARKCVPDCLIEEMR